jgi:DNA-binding transcriptional MerR regulator
MAKFYEMKPEKQKALLLLTQQIVDPNAPRLTYGEIAKQCGISERQLHRWRTADKEFAEARKELVDAYADELVADAFSALKWQLRNKRNVKAAEVLLKSRGMLVDRKEVTGELTQNINDLSAADNERLAEELEALKRKLNGETATDAITESDDE